MFAESPEKAYLLRLNPDWPLGTGARIMRRGLVWQRVGPRGPGESLAVLLRYAVLLIGGLTAILLIGNNQAPLLARGVALAAMGSVLVATWRLTNVGIFLGQTAFRVVNPLGTVKVRIGDVSEFRLDKASVPLLRFPVLVGTAFLRNGSEVRIWSLALRDPPLPTQFQRVTATLESLNRLRRPSQNTSTAE